MPEREESFWSKLVAKIPQFVLIYLAVGYLQSMITPAENNRTGEPKKPIGFRPLWTYGEPMDLYFYMDYSEQFSDFSDDKLMVKETNILYGDLDDVRSRTFNISCAEMKKRDVYGHFFLVKAGMEPRDGLYCRQNLVKHRKRITKKNLLDADSDYKEEIVPHWYPNITAVVVANAKMHPLKGHPGVMRKLSVDGDGYYPTFYINEFWMTQDALIPIDEQTQVQVNFVFHNIASWKFELYMQFEESFRIQIETLGMDSAEHDQMKKIFIDTNPVLLAVTILVSVLHSILDFMAFKNDVSFWKNKKNMEGMSFRTIAMNVVFQSIILLYLLDNDTSYLICASNAVGLLIEVWKINKTVQIKKKDTFPYFMMANRHEISKLAEKTQEYDRMAFSYLSYVFFPLMIAYTAYSVVYEQHKSWYSFIIGTAVGFVYTFGFIAMTPQLFINYKLKSVAHMPGKTFMYKAVNTFIDDLFAFVIKMPWMHRLACLRDDAVFLVYLYQRWIYPEDKRRRNEFGQVGDDDADWEEGDLQNSADEKKELDVVNGKLDSEGGDEPKISSSAIKSSEPQNIRKRK